MSGQHQHIFISHATADDAFVKELRIKLELHGLTVWADSRNLRGGDKLWPEVAEAIRTARHVLVVISPQTINSDWVFDEIELAEQVEKERADYHVIPLMLPGITPKALKRYFTEEPAGEKIELDVRKLEILLKMLYILLILVQAYQIGRYRGIRMLSSWQMFTERDFHLSEHNIMRSLHHATERNRLLSIGQILIKSDLRAFSL